MYGPKGDEGPRGFKGSRGPRGLQVRFVNVGILEGYSFSFISVKSFCTYFPRVCLAYLEKRERADMLV